MPVCRLRPVGRIHEIVLSFARLAAPMPCLAEMDCPAAPDWRAAHHSKTREVRAVHHRQVTDSARNLSKLGHLTGVIPP